MLHALTTLHPPPPPPPHPPPPPPPPPPQLQLCMSAARVPGVGSYLKADRATWAGMSGLRVVGIPKSMGTAARSYRSARWSIARNTRSAALSTPDGRIQELLSVWLRISCGNILISRDENKTIHLYKTVQHTFRENPDEQLKKNENDQILPHEFNNTPPHCV